MKSINKIKILLFLSTIFLSHNVFSMDDILSLYQKAKNQPPIQGYHVIKYKGATITWNNGSVSVKGSVGSLQQINDQVWIDGKLITPYDDSEEEEEEEIVTIEKELDNFNEICIQNTQAEVELITNADKNSIIITGPKNWVGSITSKISKKNLMNESKQGLKIKQIKGTYLINKQAKITIQTTHTNKINRIITYGQTKLHCKKFNSDDSIVLVTHEQSNIKIEELTTKELGLGSTSQSKIKLDRLKTNKLDILACGQSTLNIDFNKTTCQFIALNASKQSTVNIKNGHVKRGDVFLSDQSTLNSKTLSCEEMNITTYKQSTANLGEVGTFTKKQKKNQSSIYYY